MKVASEIGTIVQQHAGILSGLSEEVLGAKPTPDKWSAKEIIGHLVDSAQNNIQRFVRSQYEDTPRIVYAQDDWVRLSGYQRYAKADLIGLWVAINRHLCNILVTMNPVNYEKQCNTGKTSVELHTLAYLAEDYRSHLLHHLNQLKERIKYTEKPL